MDLSFTLEIVESVQPLRIAGPERDGGVTRCRQAALHLYV